ncbi:hypothetical protein BDA96_05G172500 [Sorghum bicolor]|uniref:Barwin domain-containing protein n=1 Tax=Sorghum bicolor TaxID=4558 RepID=A0A921QYF3_SORBI|nr:hypothetical protein BDA96_05G172500 [Sorghum bicolor]
MICLLVGSAAAQQASGVVATYNQYNPAQVDWDLGAAGAFCATWDAEMPLAWRQRYGWTAFCGPAGAHGKASCGRCLLVTNAATGDQATARVVDECHNGGLDLDAAVFGEIDTDGAGAASGSLVVDYQFVDCQD